MEIEINRNDFSHTAPLFSPVMVMVVQHSMRVSPS